MELDGSPHKVLSEQDTPSKLAGDDHQLHAELPADENGDAVIPHELEGSSPGTAFTDTPVTGLSGSSKEKKAAHSRGSGSDSFVEKRATRRVYNQHQEQKNWAGYISEDLPSIAEDDARGQSSLSGTTLVKAVTDGGSYEAAREKFVSLVKNEKRLENMREDIEKLLLPETFEEIFRKMLKDFAAQLRVEASRPEERDAARAVSINRPYIANCMSEEIFKVAKLKPATMMPLDMGNNYMSGAVEEPMNTMPPFQNELLNYPANSNELVAASIAGSSPTEKWLEVRSLSSSDNGWSTIDFQQPGRQSFQTLHIRTHSDTSQLDVPQSAHSFGSYNEIPPFPMHSPSSEVDFSTGKAHFFDTPGSRNILEPRLLRYSPEVLPAAAKSITNTIRPTSNPTQQVQANSSTQQQNLPKRFQCDYPGCNSKGFSRMYELQRHIQKHSHSQMFLCPVASCRFQKLSNAFHRHDQLGCHMRIFHPGVQIPNIRDSQWTEDDGLDNELEGPINLLKLETFIESSKAWLELFDNLEGWVRDTKKAKGLEKKKQQVDIDSNKTLSENRENGSGDISSLAASWDRKDCSTDLSSKFIATTAAETKRSTKINSKVSAFQVALLSAWTIKTFVNLYEKPNSLMKIAVGYIAIILPMYSTILLPREQVLKSYILCLFIPKAYMVYANALGLALLASRTYFPILTAKTEKFLKLLCGSPTTEEETPHARVKWHCTCGDEFHEVFAEAQERDAIALFKHLCRTGNQAQLEIPSRHTISTTKVFDESSSGIASETTLHANSSTINNQQPPFVTGVSDSATGPHDEPLVRPSTHNGTAQDITSRQPDRATGVAQSSFAADSGEQRDEWFLLCHNHYENAGKALNIRVPDLIDDLSLMRHLRRQYVTSRGGFGRHFKWSKIRNFNFVRFQAHIDPLAQEELVFKDKEWSVPPNCCDSNWSPWPLKERPPVLVEKMLRHYWHYPHDRISFRFSNACKHLTRNIWHNCRSGYANILNFLSHQPAPSSIRTAICDSSKRFHRSARNWIQKIWSDHKPNKETTLPQSNRDVNLTSQAPQGNSRQQQHPGTSPAIPHTHFHQGTNPSAITQPIPQPRLPHSISSVYPRRLHTELHPNPTCYGWGLYLDEGFAVPTPLIALLLILLFAVLISTLTVALVDFHRGDRYDAFSLPSWAVSVASLVRFILFWCCDRWR